jgi:hypothetical protein
MRKAAAAVDIDSIFAEIKEFLPESSEDPCRGEAFSPFVRVLTNNGYRFKLNFVALEFLFIYKVAPSTPVEMAPGEPQQSRK